MFCDDLVGRDGRSLGGSASKLRQADVRLGQGSLVVGRRGAGRRGAERQALRWPHLLAKRGT